MGLADVVYHNLLHAVGGEGRGDGLRHLLRIAIHAAVDKDDTVLAFVAAQLVVYLDNFGDVFRPYRAVR